MNKITKYTYVLGLALVALTTACEDQGSEITEVNYERLFSPLNLEARVTNKTNVRLNWTATKGASSYTIEVFADDNLTFTGTPAKTIEGITVAELPYTITGLEGETQYSIRVKAVGEDIEASKWSTATATTDTEQIFEAVKGDELTATSVTLHWKAGEVATEIVLTPSTGKTYTVTAEEIAVGAKTITELTSETTYSAKLMNGSKTRGVITFTTLIDLSRVHTVYPGDDLAAIIAAAEANETIALLPAQNGDNEFSFIDDTGNATTLEIELTKDITIKGAYANNCPTVHAKFILKGCNNLYLENLNFDGSGNLVTVIDSNGGEISITNCNVTTFDTFLIETGETQVGTINRFSVDNCIFHDMKSSKRFVDYQKLKSFIAEFTLKNSTIYNCCSSSDFIRFDRHATKGNVINISNCTLYGIEATSKGLLYIRSSSAGKQDFTANISNCIFAKMSDGVFFSKDTKTDNLKFDSNYYFDTPSLLANPDGGAGKAFDTKGVVADPIFKNAANGDFTVSNEDIIYYKIGDPRWIK